MSRRGPTVTVAAIGLGAAALVVLAIAVFCPGVFGGGRPQPPGSSPPASGTGSDDRVLALVMRTGDSGPWSALDGSVVDGDVHVALQRAEGGPPEPDAASAAPVRYRLRDPAGGVSVLDVSPGDSRSGIALPLSAASTGRWRLEATDGSPGPMTSADFTVSHSG